MEKLDPRSDGSSMDMIEKNIEKLKALFPEIVTDGKVDFEVLKEVLGDEVDDREERYHLTWYGKKRTRRLALSPSTGTLRPKPEESVNWDVARNLFIEGDNLEVLKLLQKSYHNAIKFIYIDPPYNTGRDFIYPDNFSNTLKQYKMITNQVDESGSMISSNSDTAGRYHTNWLNMIYSRLKLARNLLLNTGSIAISIDDTELANLRKLCDEIFGEENFIGQIIWKKRNTPPNDKIVGTQHDYILLYCKNADQVELNLRERTQRQVDRYKNPDNHPKGPWAPSDLTANIKGGRYVESLYYPIKNPNTGEDHFPSNHGNWRFNNERVQQLLDNDEIYFGADGRGKPMLKRFLSDIKEGITWTSIWDFVPLNTAGSQEMSNIMGNSAIFENPKPSGLIKHLLQLCTASNDNVMDFFAGSGSTAHAVIDLNRQDGGSRRFILVQLPEPCPSGSTPKEAGYKTISDIAKERIRRVIKAHSESNKGSAPLFASKVEDGFRVFSLDSSNIQVWEGRSEEPETELFSVVENLKPDRTESDILYELLLKYGLNLVTPIERRIVVGKTVHVIGEGALVVCLEDEVTVETVEGIAALKDELNPEVEIRVVFKDAGFKDDVVKTNAVQILRQIGITDVKSL